MKAHGIHSARYSSEVSAANRLFAGEGELRRLCREFDWSKTPIGPVSGWSTALRITASLVLAAPSGMILLWGPDLVQIYNDAYASIMGRKHPGGLGQRNIECWPEAWDFTGPVYEAVLKRGESLTFTDQRLVLERSGAPEETFFTLSYSPVIEDDGHPGGILVTVTETTAEVRARAARAERDRLATALEAERRRLLEVFQSAPSFIAVLHGPDQTYVSVNEAYLQIIGHRNVIGKPLMEALPELEGQGFKELLDRVRDTGEPWIGRETPVQLQRTPGAPVETRYLDMIFKAHTNADGVGIGVIAHGSDVTDHVLAHRALEEANRTLRETAAALERRTRELQEAASLAERTSVAEASNRAKSEFLAMMSHELRTPLNAIGGYSELLLLELRGPLTDEQRADIERIQRSQRHLLGLINQVLNYAKVDRGSLKYAVSALVVGEVLEATEALMAPQLFEAGLRCDFSRCERDLHVRADPDKLQQILLNLLTNAIKFTKRGGQVVIASRKRADMVEIIVEDNGIGIPADRLESIFEPFVQIDAALTRTHAGVGLGLAISRDLARAMGGDLAAESDVGRGSRFTLTLPSAS